MARPSKKLIRMLRCAHSSELGAFHAYEGHIRSLSCPIERDKLRNIQNDEWMHVLALRRMLDQFNATPNRFLDLIFTLIGKTAAKISRITGRYLPMKGAALIEAIGFNAYREIASEASKCGNRLLVDELLQMALNEYMHEEYLEGRACWYRMSTRQKSQT
jgi:demethoxyubiquinone hydroxylase (CLK1/Coq7/Cat5 family)